MKKHLLFSRVNHDGRTTVERRSNDGQSKGRYSVGLAKLLFTITLLLTLGVGQMWGAVTLKYQKNMPAGNYDASNSATMTQSSANSNRYYCEISLDASSNYGFFIKNGNDYYKANATASSNRKTQIWNYGSSNYGGSNHRITYTSGSAGKYIFTVDFSNSSEYVVFVSPKSSETVKMAWDVASGHDSWYNLDNYDQMSQDGSTANYTVDLDLTAAKHYMFIQLSNSIYWRGTSTLTTSTPASLKDYGTNNYGGSSDKVNFTPSAAGKYRFTWNHDDKTVSFQRVYAVIYNDNGKTSGSVPSTTYHPNGATVTVASNSGSLAKTGYDFGGWNENSSGTGTNYTAGSGTFTMSTSDKNLYAKWTPQTYNITYKDKGDVAFSGAHQDGYPTTHTYGTATTLDSPTKEGYTFGGWYTNSTCTTSAGASIGATAKTADFTLYAKWTAKQCSITFDKNGGANGDNGTTGTYDAAMTTITPPTKTGYNFDGYWDEETNNDGTGTKYYNADGTSAHTWDKNTTSATTLYAKWTEKTYNVTVTSNNFSYGTVMSGQTSSQTVSAKHFTSDCSITAEALSGYRFTGWTYSGSVVIADASATSTTIKATATGATVTANFEALPSGQLDIVAGANGQVKKQGGDWGSSASYTDINTAQDLNIYAQSNTGYHFVNWTKSGDGSIKTNAANGVYTLTARGSATVTANFAASSYTVTLDKQSGSGGPASVSATYDAAMPTPTTMPTRTGYDFNGYWGSAGGSGTKYYNADGSSAHAWDVASATSIYAYWTAHNYTITYSPSSAPTGCTYTTKPTSADYNTTVDMVITPSTGYTVSVSAVDASSNVVTVTPGANNHYTFTQPASAVTVTVTATEIMSTLTTSNSYDGADPSWTAPTKSVSSIGVTTTATVTAHANDLGYTLTSWTITGGTRTDGGAANANSITVRSNGDGAAVSVTANYVGSNRLVNIYLPNTGNSWSTSDANWRFYKLPGESGNTVTLAVDINKNSYSSAGYQLGFNIYHSDWSTKWWHNKNYEDSYMYAHNCTNWGFNAGEGEYGTYLDLNVSGTYTFTLTNSNNSGSQQLSVAYPDKSFIEGAFPTAWNEDAYTLSEDGDIQSVTINITSTGDKTFRLVSHGKLFGTTTTFTAASNSHTLSAKKMSDGSDALMTIGAYLTGEYTFSYNKSTKILTITWPVVNQVRISNASPADATNVGNFDLSAPASNVRTVTRSLKANTTYTFKVVYNSEWYGHNSKTFTRETSTSSNTRTIATSSDDMTLTTDYAGDYTFRFNQSTKELSIDFPEAYKVTYSKGAVDGSSGNSCSAKDIDNGNASVTSNSTWVKKDHQVVMTAPNEDGGYTFDGWFDNNSSTGDAITTAKNCTITVISEETYYACYHEHKTAITINTDGHGTITTPSPNNSPYSLGVATSQTINATASEGYHWNTWTTDGTAVLVSSAATQSNTVKGDGTEGSTGTVTATFSPNTYRVQFHRNGGAGDVVYQNFTYDEAQNLTANTYTRTGYNFAGWALSTSGEVEYTNGANVSNLTSENGATFHLYAKWTPKTTTITYSQSGTGYGSGGQSTTQTAIYDAAMPTPITTPTAANGYAFMGYYDALEPLGTQYYDGAGASAHAWDKEDAETTLYAYFKKAEITALTLDNPTIAPEGTVTVTPTVSPTPTGTTSICWKLLRSNGNEIATEFERNPSTPGNDVTFTAPSASGSYTVQAILRIGGTCEGTALDTLTTGLVVAGEHEVVIRYQDSDGRTLAASAEIIGKPLEWSSAIVAPTITGYTFSKWVAGDGVTLSENGSSALGSDESSSTTVYVKANYDGTLTAVYNKKNMIYFYNTLGWSDVYVYFYSSDAYWVKDHIAGQGCGTGSDQNYDVGGSKAYFRGYHGHMTQIEGTNIWYYDYEAEHGAKDGGEIKGYDDVVFVETEQNNYHFFTDNKASRRGDFKHSMPMFVPINEVVETKNGTKYYSHGYWMNYPDNTGYTLKLYNAYNADKETAVVREFAFPFSEDLKMPLKMDVEFNDGGNHEYWFMVYRNDGTYMGAVRNFDQNHHTEQAIEGNNNKPKLITSAPGNYTFTLTYHGNGLGTYNYYIDVDFPIAVGDYRIYYSDNATWSHDAHTKDSWYHPSHSITKATDAKKDTLSFFVTKGEGITHTMKFQYASAISDAGAITWTDVDGGSITIPSSITESGVYNFIVSQPAGGASISLENVEPYTGNYYIRTDCAGSTKWDSYTTLDHHMTYSDYAAAGPDDFTHYYCHWVTAGTNVKFTIANDYSVAVSDTVEGDTYTTQSLVANANIRFMYDERTNRIKRAYIAGSGDITDRFLVLEGDSKLFDENGNALVYPHRDSITYNKGLPTQITKKLDQDNQVILHDDENFLYERTIMVNPQARAKLTARYNNKVQYFKGSEGDFADETTIQLLGGATSADTYKMRIVYDFKTNRIVTAYMPEGEIGSELAINADMMLIREHQGDATQLTFADEDAKLTDVKSVYGVMRFNRWILNNRQNPTDHAKDHSDTDAHITEFHPYVDAGSQKSSAERGLYWVSFPFDVNLSDVFGFGTYGVHWVMMEYNGAERARIGYWKDNEDGFWEYIWDRRGVTLEKGKGYMLALDLARMKDNDRTFWSHEIQQVELFFPSVSTTTGEISQTNVDVTVLPHECTIDRRTDKTVADWNKDRRIADSHWNIIGVPSYANYGETLTDGSSVITWNSNPKTQSLPFLYEWNPTDNTYTVQSGTTYSFRAMHAYYVQYAGTLYWTLASATPPSSLASRRNMDALQSVEFKLELGQNEKMIDQTFVKLSNNEDVSAGFAFGEDMNKEFNADKANIYTFIDNYIPTAGNTMPMTEQTTVIPVGVKIATDGDYTFAIPNGTNGVGVTLIDTETGVRTSLSALDYTINLSAGTYDNRFVMEISPIQQISTDIENSEISNQNSDVRKVMIDQIMYIIKDGVMYDARGARVQ